MPLCCSYASFLQLLRAEWPEQKEAECDLPAVGAGGMKPNANLYYYEAWYVITKLTAITYTGEVYGIYCRTPPFSRCAVRVTDRPRVPTARDCERVTATIVSGQP